MNPAEIAMSVLNIGIQNCSLERKACAEDVEKALKKCNGRDNTKKYGAEHPDFKTALVRNYRQRLALKTDSGGCH